MNEYLALGGFFLACLVTAGSGAIFKPGAWYENLRKPWWRPPNWLFPPAWAVLFCFIAVAGWLVWRQVGFTTALVPWVVQLVLNFAWSWLFFGKRRTDWALWDLSAMWTVILVCIVVFWPISQAAAWLFVPYLAWVTFAGALNWKMLSLNGRHPA